MSDQVERTVFLTAGIGNQSGDEIDIEVIDTPMATVFKKKRKFWWKTGAVTTTIFAHTVRRDTAPQHPV